MGWKEFPPGTWVLDYTTANGYHFEGVHPAVLDNEYVVVDSRLARELADVCWSQLPLPALDPDEGDDPDARVWRIIDGRLVPAPDLDSVLGPVTGPAPNVDPATRPDEFHGAPVSPGIPEQPYDAMAAYKELYERGETATHALEGDQTVETELVGGFIVTRPVSTAGSFSTVEGPFDDTPGEVTTTQVDVGVELAAMTEITCLHCDREFATTAGLKSHVRAKHHEV